MFVATLNQVDLDGGYTGWTQRDFVEVVRDEARKIDFKGPMIIALDHGGPWLKDRQAMEKWSLDDAMDGVKKSLVASLEAGYDLLHIDPTVDRTLPKGETMAIETVVERTLDLIECVEAIRRERNLPKISYEVGTEEVHGGLADLNAFRKLLKVGKALTPTQELEKVAIIIEYDKIKEVVPWGDIPRNGDVLNYPDAIAAPGFVDIHTHGYGGHDVTSGKGGDLTEIAKSLPKHGVTSFLPTTVTAPQDVLLK
ncbi:unnamed protein product, partial [marine sediment metagenome]